MPLIEIKPTFVVQQAAPTEGGYARKLFELVKPALGTLIVTIAVLFIVIIYALITQSSRRPAIRIEPIGSTESLTKAGYTPEALARLLGGHLAEVTDTSVSDRQTTSVDERRKNFDFSVPGTSITAQTIIDQVSSFFGRSTISVTGSLFEVEGEKAKKFRLLLASSARPTQRLIKVEGDGIDEAFRAAAIEILEDVDPYVAAAYLQSKGRTDDSKLIVYRMYAEAQAYEKSGYVRIPGVVPTELHWVYLMWGFIFKDEHQYMEAHQRFITANEAFRNQHGNKLDWPLALDGAALALIEVATQGGISAAEAKRQVDDYERRAITAAPGYTSAYHTLGSFAANVEKDFCAALSWYRKAAEKGPMDASAWAEVGTALLEVVRNMRYENRVLCNDANLSHVEEQAQQSFELAVGADRRLVSAWIEWGILLQQRCELDAAAEKFHRALRLEPSNSDAPSRLHQIEDELAKKRREPAEDCSFAGASARNYLSSSQ
jgi:tetratricopeptide (TPR) repeat protein